MESISLQLDQHEVFSLIGPSGCGSSTFLRALDAKKSGEILLDGRTIASLDVVDLRQRAGMVFQTSNPFLKTVFENVAYGLRIGGIREKNMLAEKVEQSLRQAAPSNEVKDRLGSLGAVAVGRPSAPALHRPSPRRRARGRLDG